MSSHLTIPGRAARQRLMLARGARYLVGAAILLLLVVLAACGGQSTLKTGTIPGAGGISSQPCTGGTGSASDAGTPKLVLTPSTPNLTGSAHVGDLVQVQLPTTSHWDFEASVTSVTPLQPSGFQDQALKVCVWNFHMQATGNTTLTFLQTALCGGGGTPCANYAKNVKFTVQVS